MDTVDGEQLEDEFQFSAPQDYDFGAPDRYEEVDDEYFGKEERPAGHGAPDARGGFQTVRMGNAPQGSRLAAQPLPRAQLCATMLMFADPERESNPDLDDDFAESEENIQFMRQFSDHHANAALDVLRRRRKRTH